MKNKKVLLLKGVLLWGVFTLLFSCTTEQYVHQQSEVKGEPYNPNAPVEITGFIPNSGRIREKIVISGQNFGNDRTKIKVYFDDGFTDREANVISVDGTSIYCLAPRQNTGDNKIKISVNGTSPVVSDSTFSYTAATNVSWVAGVGLRDGVGGKYADGTLSEAHFWQPQAILSLGDEQFMTFGYYSSPGNNVRLISVKDDKVVTLQNGVYLGKGAINEDKTVVYATTLNPPHTVYEYRKEMGWTPYNIGTIKEHGSGNDRIRALVMMDKAHDPDQKYLYFCHNRSQSFGRYNVQTEETEIIADGTLTEMNQVNFASYMAYDKFKDCFYVSVYQNYSIYKITKTGDDWGDGVKAELYAGSPSQSAVIDGDLADARFRDPKGICVDDEGNLIICDSNNADVLRMISAVDGYVSTLAGTLGVESPQVNGAPGEAIFLDLQDVTYDGEGGYYICEWWESTIRKYSVE